MSRRTVVAAFAPLFITVATRAAFASPPPSGSADATEQPAKLTETFSVLHAVSQWSMKLSAMADQRAKSDLVKNYAHEMATSNSENDAKLMAIAQKHGINVSSPDPQTEEGKSLLDRMKAETALLSSLHGDAFDKEYMTLVTNTQQSVINFLEARKAAATDPDTQQFMGNLITTVQGRLKTAQDIMAKVYGNSV
jgi:predicted outer membrane protein